MSAATPSTYFSSSHARRLFPIPAIPMTEARRARPSRDCRVEQVLEELQLLVAADERRLDPAAAAGTRAGPRRRGPLARRGPAPILPRRSCSPAASKTIASPAARRVASPDEHGAGRRGRLESRGRVDEVARDHPLPLRADDRGGLARQHRGARLRPLTAGCREARDRRDEVERRADGALGVVLADGRRAPHGHDRVADELLDRAAVPLDDLAGHLEVAAEELADRLRVAVVGEGREADEIGEQDADEPALGGRAPGRRPAADAGRQGARACRSACPTAGSPGTADVGATIAAEAVLRVVGRATGRAGRCHGRAAGPAELPPRPVLAPARSAVHRRSVARPGARRREGSGGPGWHAVGFGARWLPGQVRAER